jgi:flavin reductase (DIM6/NTAB) family NADH-FMN oxidoreductase RutF
MNKIDIGSQGFIYPMPMTLIGVDLDSGPSFMPVAWINRVQADPPRIAAGMNARHATNEGIRQHWEFSVCLPSEDLVVAVDWCGMRSANRGVDKGAAFTIWRGNLDHAPMIAECPLCLECRLERTVDLGSHELFVADVVGTWCDESALSDGMPDVEKLRPFTLTMPDNRYWKVGGFLGKAWSIGREFEHPLEETSSNAPAQGQVGDVPGA